MALYAETMRVSPLRYAPVSLLGKKEQWSRNFVGKLRSDSIPSTDQRVPHISLAFGEMWDTATVS